MGSIIQEHFMELVVARLGLKARENFPLQAAIVLSERSERRQSHR
jgi:hypothetical protein